MPRGRFISKTISVSEQLGTVSLEADFLFGRCIPFLDVKGRMTGTGKGIKAQVVPLREELTSERIETLLSELENAGLVVWYAVKGQKFLFFPGFRRHNGGKHLDRESASKIPPPPQTKAAKEVKPAQNSGVSPEYSGPVQEFDALSSREVKSSVVKGKGEPPENGSYPSPKLERLSQADCELLRQAWAKRIGVVQFGLFRKQILPLFEVAQDSRPPVADVAAAIEAFSEWWIEQDDREQGFWTVTKFVNQFAKWNGFGHMPLVENGEPTERGNWAGSKALRQRRAERQRA